ncbi:MAG: hypothetical protein N2C12_12785, partial [Planctomycetales bacterium]
MTDFNVRDTETLPLIIESIARRVVAVERRSPQFTEAVSVVEVQDLDSRPDPEGPDSYCYVVLTADWYETSANGFLPPPNPPIPVYQWVTSTGPPVVPPGPTPLPDPLLISDGTAAAPSLAFTADTDTGMYRAGTNEIGFTAGGVELLSVGSADVDVVTGHLNVFSNTGSDTISLGEYSGGSNLAAIETSSFYALLGTGNPNDAAFIRTKGTGPLILGASHGSNLTIATGGAITLSSDLTVGGDVIASDGSATAPSLTFASDGDTGVFLPAANQLGFAAGGVELLRVGSADVDVMTGHLNLISNTGAQTMSLGEWSSGFNYAAVETPSMVVLMGNASDINSQGFIRTKGTGSLNLGVNNSNDLTITSGGAVSTVGDITAGGDIVTAVGSAGAPSHTFTGFTTSGMYQQGTNEVGFATAGTENLRLTGSNLRMASATSIIYNTGYFRGVAATGTVSSPTYSWDGDSNTGMYRAAADTIGWSLGGVRKMQLSPDRLYLFGGTGNSDYIGPVNANYFYLSTGSNAFYFNKGVRVDTGIIGSHNENLQLTRAGTTKMTMTTTQNISNQKFKIDGPNVGTAAKTWTSSQFLIESLDASGNDTTNSIVQMAFHNDRYNIAFNVRNYGPEGTTLGFANSGNTAFIPIRASAFTVMSTIRIKQDIEAVEDADAIALSEK